MIEQWQRICILAERIIKRREGAAVRIPSALKRTYLPAHFNLPFSNYASSPSPASLSSPSSSSSSSNARLHATNDVISSGASVLSGSTMAGSVFGGGLHEHTHVPAVLDQQADLARLTNTMKVLMEVNERCWRGDNCDLCSGVRTGLGHTAEHLQRHSDMLEQRVRFLALVYCVMC
jgi:sorting nexin-8